jgi:hypothetical protein
MARKSKKFNYGKAAFYLLLGGAGLGVASKIVNTISNAKRKKELMEEYEKLQTQFDDASKQEMARVAAELRKLGIGIS